MENLLPHASHPAIVLVLALTAGAAIASFGIDAARADPERKSVPTIHLASWDVSHAEKAVMARAGKEAGPSWRHTFGSERRDRKKKRGKIFNLSSDVVLLQGVRNIRALKRVFPRRAWKIIVSRRNLMDAPRLSRLPSDLQAFDVAAGEPFMGQSVVAVAVRYNRRVRVRAVRHFRTPISNTDTTDIHTGHATGILLSYHGVPLWLISAEINEPCQPRLCPAWRAIATWSDSMANQQDATAPTLFGWLGRGSDSKRRKTALQSDTCSTFTVNESRPTSEIQVTLGKQHRVRRPKLGCITLASLKISAAARPLAPLSETEGH